MSAVRAPLRSSTVLMAMVEPCSSSESAGVSQWASAKLSATPRVGSAGTVEHLEVTIRPSTQPTRSVKVPPMSTPTMFMRTRRPETGRTIHGPAPECQPGGVLLTIKKKQSLGRAYGAATARHHHERRHRAHGHESAPDPLDLCHPRSGWSSLEKR